MEIFERVKAIMFNPKEEWTIIEDENSPHVKVFAGYLLILALIPAVAIFISEWWTWHSLITEYIAKLGATYGSNNVRMEEAIAQIKARYPFDVKWAVIIAVQAFIHVLGGSYISALVINALSDQFGSTKNFDRAFALVAYSYTPLCIAGILFIYKPLAWLIPYLGLYGLYLLYFGIEPQLKPGVSKKTVCFIISLATMIAVWAILSKLLPEISKSIMMEMVKSSASDAIKNLQHAIPR